MIIRALSLSQVVSQVCRKLFTDYASRSFFIRFTRKISAAPLTSSS